MGNAAAQQSAEPIKVILCTIAYRKSLFEQALNVAHDLGFDGIEAWGREPHLPEKFEENRMRATRKLLESFDIQPFVFGSYLRFGSTKNDLDVELGDVLHIARWLKTPLIRVWASDVGSASASEKVWKTTVEETQIACERAAKLGMTLAVEMHGGTLADTSHSALRLIEQVERENLKLNFQVASHNDDQTPEERLRMVLPWVAHVHAQNYAGLPEREGAPVKRVPLSTGVANYPNLIGMLKDANYSGSIALEFAYDETGDKMKALAEDLQFLRAVC